MSGYLKTKREPQKAGFSGGFTIVELMIALSVLSVLLLISTVTLMNLGKMYVKGDNMARAQEATRNIASMIADQVRLGGNVPSIYTPSDYADAHYDSLTSDGYFCIGRIRYSYLLDRQVTGSPDLSLKQTRHALWRDELPSSTCPTLNPPASTPLDLVNSTNPGINGQELVPGNMRLTELKVDTVNGDSGMYSVTVGIAYGDNDLLCNSSSTSMLPDGAPDCSAGSIAKYPGPHFDNLRSSGGNIRCISGTGQQFCAVSSVSVSVARRVISE